ncbi:glycosyltransferase family 2 protein [Capnocytophaga sp.]|uniref:glycosyltransferase family 2 protein n=1 Tax=Capnocytophaga sp. TaxID=44737 RepID=UPI0026DC1BC8|nr:glycosyltransferase family 2 protein [Capnocytophaga sp.]MDO5104542.1 glycosyltransferase family 2 protein [Capnocytophaga sp.]
MTVAVVILNWNGRALLEKFLPSVLCYSPQAAVYVVDNASTDDSVTMLKTDFPQVEVIELPFNGGYARGYNAALEQITADVYCLLNSDVEVTENWLANVPKWFADDAVGAVQPKILDYKHREKFEYAGAAGGFIDKYGFPFCRGRIFDTIETDNGQYDTEKTIFWASGACFFVRSAVFHRLNGFDTDFFAHQEEIDFCWRLHHLGKKVVFSPESVVYHIGGATLPTDNPQKTYLNFRNSLFMLLKNLPQQGLYSTLFLRMVLDGIAGVRFALQGKFWFTWAIVRAHFGFYKRFFAVKSKRTPGLFSSYYYIKSVVWAYFVKNKKFFNELN